MKSWLVGSNPVGLSVNKAHNVVVTCHGANKLQEYTTDGSLVREISLQQARFTKPWHAVQLSTGDYAVSHGTSPGVVSIVGVNGQVAYSCQSQTSSVGLMNHPSSLAVTNNADILVSDSGNNRILCMNSSLSSVQELVLSVDGQMQQPFGLCLDESRGRLYVSEFGGGYGGRVLVFESCKWHIGAHDDDNNDIVENVNPDLLWPEMTYYDTNNTYDYGYYDHYAADDRCL